MCHESAFEIELGKMPSMIAVLSKESRVFKALSVGVEGLAITPRGQGTRSGSSKAATEVVGRTARMTQSILVKCCLVLSPTLKSHAAVRARARRVPAKYQVAQLFSSRIHLLP